MRQINSSARFQTTYVFILFFAVMISGETAYAQFWCGQILTPPAGPPPTPTCCPCKEDCQGSPNFPASGNYALSNTDLHLSTRGFPLAITRNYDSVRLVDGPFGISWTTSLTGNLSETTYLYSAPSTYYKEVTILMEDGKPYGFRENPDGSYTPNPPSHFTLTKNPDGSFDLNLPQTRIKHHYDSSGMLTTQTDEYGNALVLTYNGNGSLDRVTDGTGSGRYLEFIYGADGRVSSVRDSANRTVSYTYNVAGALTSVIDPVSRQTTYAYITGRFGPMLQSIRDHWNRLVTTVTYDSSDRTKTYTENGETYTYVYNYQNDPLKVSKTDSSGRVWVYSFLATGPITSRVPPAGHGGGTTTSSFNPDKSVQFSIDETGIKTSYTYNPNGTVTTITRDDQGAQAVRYEYAYDSSFPEKVTSITPVNPSTGLSDPNWQAWQYDYYQAGSTAPGALHHVYKVRSDGSTLDTLATYTYNSAGQVLTVTDGSGGVTSYSYNATTGDLLSVTYPKNSDGGPNPVYQYGRDLIGRVTTVTDPLNHATTYTYDNIDRITSMTLPKPSAGSPLNFVTGYSYDNYDAGTGLVFTHQTDPNTNVTKQGYDQFGQMVRSIDALNKTTIFTYTKGLLTAITDANNNVTSYAYNGIHRLTTTTFPNGATETYTYYPDGLLNTKTDRKNQTITYSYDRLKRLVTKTYPNSTAITYSYTGQKLDSVNDTFSSETHSFLYDASYRVASNAQGTRGTLTYTYDSADRIQGYSVSGGPSATYTYYDDGSLKDIAWSPVVGQFDYQYSLTGQYSTITFPNGQSRNYTYDDQGRLLQLANTLGQTDLGAFAYGYDNPLLGQRTSMTSALGATNYTYDSNYQLTGATYPNTAPFNGEVHAWTYDNIGNRLTNTVNASTANYTYFKNGSNPLNGQRLQSDGTKTYTYDANGNITGDGTYTFTWNYENQLTGISGGGLTASYSYDYLGRRKTKTVNGVTTNYLYDGQNVIREVGAINSEYVFGRGIDEPLAQNTGGIRNYYNIDALGSPITISDSSAAIQNSYTYDGWGIIRNQSGSAPNPLTYTARESGEAGLYYYRARYYNPNVGRFISEDPLATVNQEPPTIRFKNSNFKGLLLSENAYNYASLDPISNYDPSGLASQKCCPECSGGYWSGIGYDVSLFMVLGVYIAEGTLKCVTNPSMKVHFMVYCKGAMRGWSKNKGWGVQLVGSANAISVHCFGAPCPEDLSGDSISSGGGKGYAIFGGEIGVSTGFPTGSTCFTAGLGVGIGGGVSITGCQTFID
jgi:RHS repeat-associated protein